MRSASKDIGEVLKLPPSGSIFKFGGSLAPIGWLICDGSAISRAKYSTLFGIIGTLYGSGDGSTTFNLPDLRGRVAVGYAPSGGHADVGTIGNNDGVVAANRRPKHKHSTHYHQTNGYNNQLTTNTTGGIAFQTNLADTSGFLTTSNNGGTGNTSDPLDAPAYLVINRIIKI